MYSIKTRIEFIAPFLYNRPKDERGPGGAKSEAQYLEEAKLNVHRSNSGELILPAWNIKQAIVEACKKTFKGKQSITDLAKATLFPEDASFGIEIPDFIHTCWGRVPPRTGAMVKVYRPAMNKGAILTVVLNVTDDRLPEDKLRLAWEQCGLLVGFGSWRPENGRFLVKEWSNSSFAQRTEAMQSVTTKSKARKTA